MSEKLTADRIVAILASQHSDDVFVTECKDGASQTRSHNRMDAWVMNKSWSRLCFTAYEVKVSRNDFKQDEKWHSYLPLCNQLYFVCPKGLIEKDEMPDNVGLKYATLNRVMTVKKAAHRDIRPPMELFCYILMCRARIGGEVLDGNGTASYWRDWLKQKHEDRHLGYMVRRAIAEKVEDVERKNRELEMRMKTYDDHKELMKKFGFNPDSNSYHIQRTLEEWRQIVPPELPNEIKRLQRTLADIEATIEQETKRLSEKLT